MLQKSRKSIALAIAIAVSTVLVGCSGSEERQAKYVERAQQLFDKDDLTKARIEVKNALQINSNNADARYLMAEIEEREHNWQQMYGNLSAALETDPTMLKARVKLAQLLFATGQTDRATEETDKILKQDPKSPDGYALRAFILLRQGKQEEATAQAQKAQSLKPGHADSAAILAKIYATTDPAKAEHLLEDVLKIDQNNKMLRLLLIKVLAQEKKNDQVVAEFKRVIADNPEDLSLTSALAKFYVANQRFDEAESTLRGVVEKYPDNVEAKLLVVDFLTRQRSPEKGLEQLKQYSDAAPDDYKLRSALGRFYVLLRKPEDAIATFQYTVDKDPTSAEAIDARNRIIELLLVQNKRPQAEQLIKEVLKLEPENADALLTRARLEMVDKDADSAIADLRTVLKNTPDSTPALMLLAEAQEHNGTPDLALDNYKKLLDKNADNVPALIGAARIEVAKNQLSDAQKHLEHAHQRAADNIEATRLLVDIYSRQKLWEQAFDLCDSLQINQKTAPIGYYLSGLVHARKDELPEAISAFKKSLEKEPRAIEPLQMLITTLVAAKQNDQALRYLEKHVQDHPDQIHAQQLLGSLYRQIGKLTQAEKTLKGVIAKEPQQVQAYRELAAVYVAQGRASAVEGLYQQGLQHNPDNTALMLLLAEFYQNAGQNQKALDYYTTLQQRLPRSKLIKNNLATLLIDKFPSEDNLRRAQSLTAEFADSENPLLIDTLGWLQYKMKNYPQAVALLESAVHKNDGVPEMHYHLGMAYLMTNNAAKAKQELGKALANPGKFPGRDQAETALSKL